MPSVTIDTCILAPPTNDTTREAVIDYVVTLLDWKELLKNTWVDIYMSERAMEIMQKEDVYPIRPSLTQLFQARGLQFAYSANDIARFVDDLFKKTPYFETHFKIQDVLVSNIETSPNLVEIHSSKPRADDLIRIAVVIAILRSCCRNPVLDHSLIIKPRQGSSVVKVIAQIDIIETTRDDMLDLPKPPEFFSGDILTCQNFREFVQNLDEIAIWESSTDKEGLELALKIAIFKSRLERNIEPDWDTIQGFSFGREFLERLRACERGGNPGLVARILRSLTETIEKLNMRAIHPKRKGGGGDDPQEMRKKDKAWRRDIDAEYHLHYWECADGAIEFASVGPHNMFDIPK